MFTASASFSIPLLTNSFISSVLVWIESGAAESRRSVIAETSFSRTAISSRMYLEWRGAPTLVGAEDQEALDFSMLSLYYDLLRFPPHKWPDVVTAFPVVRKN